jgi:cytochrome c oxidase assembly factor CtaG
MVLLLTAACYARGFTRLHRAQPERFPRWRAVAFAAGLGTLWIALASPLDAFSGLLLQVHMLQHWLLMMVAPPLLLLGAPLVPLLRGLPRSIRHDALGPFLASPGLQRAARAVFHPIVGWLALALATWLWHLPAAYELALRSRAWHEVEHACFVVTAILFWWPVIEPWPARSLWPRAAMIPYLVLADLQNTAFSALFAFSDRVFYPSYVTAPRLLGGSPLEDQGAAGTLMWVLGSLALLAPVGFLVRGLLEPKGLRTGPPARARSTSAPVRHRKRFDLLRVPWLGRVLRSGAFRRAAQTACFLLAVAVVVDGFLGPGMSPMNLAGVLPWTYWRGFVVVALLAAGNAFCFACPFMGVRDLGRRWLPGGWRWPRRLRSKWLAVLLLAFYLGAYEIFALWDGPRATAWLVIGYFATALVVDGLFRGASFCKYLCPIGQFHFAASTLSPLEVKLHDASVCSSCATHDCIRGNASQRGCELDLFVPRKRGNLDCTFCLDCVRACPHENVGLLVTVPGRELADDAPRSSIGRIARRPDLAALALVFGAGAFVNAAGMITPVVSGVDSLAARLGSKPLAQALLLVLGLVVAPAAVIAACSLLSRTLGRTTASVRELATRFSLALLPVGITLWAAHFVFHLATGIGTIVPVLQRAAQDLGVDVLGTPDWTMAHHGTPEGVLLGLEILLLDAGVLLALYGAWRVARRVAPEHRHALGAFLPFALIAAAAWILGLWILTQPMEMRGMMMHG